MREIKFRGKGILARKGEWIYGFFKKNTHGDCYIEDEYGLSIAVDPDTVSQLVCINDNGIEIYEGDYIQDDEGVIWLVVYGNMSHGFLTHTEGILEHSEWIDDPDVYVVGNKWDTELEDQHKEADNVKRTPQEIADFFGCYVVQSRENGDWYTMLYKPTRHENGWAYTFVTDVMVINEQLISSSTNHDWTHLYEPQITCEKRIKNARATHEERMEAPYPDNKSEACYADQYDSDNKPGARKEYAIVEGKRPLYLARKVNVMLNHGWKPQGGIAVEYLPESDGYKEGSEIFYQAMVKGV